MLWLITIWVVSIILCFFIGKKSLSINDDMFDEELENLIIFIVVGLIPCLNLIIYLIVLTCVYCEERDSGISDLAKVIFHAKNDK
jgi:hypothetical protein